MNIDLDPKESRLIKEAHKSMKYFLLITLFALNVYANDGTMLKNGDRLFMVSKVAHGNKVFENYLCFKIKLYPRIAKWDDKDVLGLAVTFQSHTRAVTIPVYVEKISAKEYKFYLKVNDKTIADEKINLELKLNGNITYHSTKNIKVLL